MTQRPSRKRIVLLGLGLACLGGLGCAPGCFEPDRRPPPKVLWQDARARFVLHRVIHPAMPDDTMDYRLVLQRGEQRRELAQGHMQAKDFGWLFHATRLSDGRLAWLLGDRLCLIGGQQHCTTLPAMRCPLFLPPEPAPADARFRAAYRWVGRLRGQAPRQLAAAQALAELGLITDALAIVRRLDGEARQRGEYLMLRAKGLEARLTSDAALRRELRRELLRVFDQGGFCRQAAVLAACLPAMAPMLARAIESAEHRPRWQAGFRRIHAQCAPTRDQHAAPRAKERG